MTAPLTAALTTRQGWQRTFCYALFIFGTFTIVGMDLALIVLALLAGYERLRTPVQAPLPRWVWAPFVGYLAMIAVTAAWHEPTLGFVLKAVGRQGLWFRFLLPFALVVVLARADWRRLLGTQAAFVALLTAYAVVQYRFGVDWTRPAGEQLVARFGTTSVYHAKGTFSHHLTFAGVWLMLVPVYASLAWGARRRERWRWAAAAAVAVLGLLVSMGRSGWLGGGFGLLVLALRLPRRWAVPLVASALVGVALVATVLLHNDLRNRLYHATDIPLLKRMLVTSPTNDVERLVLWDMAWRGFSDHPLLGAGGGADTRAWDAYRDAAAAEWGWDFRGRTPKAHNMYLQIAFHHGLLGLAAFAWLWATLFWWNARWLRRAAGRTGLDLERSLLWGITGAYVGLLVQAVFQNNFTDAEVQVNLLAWMGLALAAGLRVRRALGEPGPWGA